MQESNVPVPLYRPDQGTPRSGGPIGRLRRVQNGIVRKHGDDGRIKVEKCDGFHALSRNVSLNTTGGSFGAIGVPGTTLMGTLGDELVQIGQSLPHVYAPSGPRYERSGADLVMTETAFRTVIQAGTRTISQPDAARVGTIACWVWSVGGATYAEFVDLTTNTPVRTPFQLATAGRVKVVSDGVRFWVFFDNNTTNVTVAAFGADGVVQGSATATVIYGTPLIPWDVQAMPGTGNGAVIAHNTSAGVDYVRMAFITWTGAVTVTGPVFDTHLPATYGVSFLRADFDSTHLYIATSAQFVYNPGGGDPIRQRGIYVGKVNLNGSHNAIYIINTASFPTQQSVQNVANLTGYVDSLGGAFVSWTTFETAGALRAATQLNSTVTTYRNDPEPAVTVQYGVQRSVSLSGRALKIGTRYVLPCYAASISQAAALTSQAVPVAQPTYFLIDIQTQQLVGRLEYGKASFDWPWVTWDPAQTYGDRFFMLPSSFVDANGLVHLTAGYAADVVTSQVTDGVTQVNKAIPEAGVLDIQIGGRGVPIEVGEELLIPGLRATSFSRDTFRSAGIELGGEAPTVTSVNNGSGVMAVGEKHRYGIVYSAIDSRGNRIRSIASITTAAVEVQPGHNALQLAIPTLRQTTYPTVLIEVSRDVWDNSTHVATNQLRKITVDEQAPPDTRVPIYNDKTVDAITFVDTVTNAAAAVGAPIYTDDGTLDFFACPTFSTGCVFGDRVFVGGYDNRIYYSFSKVPGQALAFNEDVLFFTVPTNQKVTALVPLDNRLFIFCERSIWYVDGGNFLSANGLDGTNPTPLELKFKNGCRGRAMAITAGVVYESSSGGIWILTRGLENDFIGKNVEDETSAASVLDIAVDEDQRIGVLLNNGKMIVYDQVTNVWTVRVLPVSGVALTTWQGRFTWADDEATQRTWQETPGAFDDNGAPIQTRIDVDDISTSDVFGFQVLWEMAALGEWKGAHTFNVDLTYDGADDVLETFSETFSTALKPFRFDWQPAIIECSSVGMSIYDTFPGNVPSQGFALEALDLYVGIERGKKYTETRISPAG